MSLLLFIEVVSAYKVVQKFVMSLQVVYAKKTLRCEHVCQMVDEVPIEVASGSSVLQEPSVSGCVFERRYYSQQIQFNKFVHKYQWMIFGDLILAVIIIHYFMELLLVHLYLPNGGYGAPNKSRPVSRTPSKCTFTSLIGVVAVIPWRGTVLALARFVDDYSLLCFSTLCILDFSPMSPSECFCGALMNVQCSTN